MYQASILLIIFILYGFNSEIYPVIVQAEKQFCTDFNGQAKKFFTFYNVHADPLPADTDQLSAFKKLLEQREEREKDHLHILIERPCTAARIMSALTPSITTNLVDQMDNFRHTTAENAEIRCVSTALLCLLKSTNLSDINSQFTIDTAQKKCCIDSTTTADLLAEYDYHKKQIDTFKETISTNLRDIFDEQITHLERTHKNLEDMLNALEAKYGKNLLTICKKIYTDKQLQQRNFRAIFADTVATPFEELFELHLFKRIIEIDAPKIALVAGAAHAQWIYQFLQEAHAERVIGYNSPNYWSEQAIPLESKQMDIF